MAAAPLVRGGAQTVLLGNSPFAPNGTVEATASGKAAPAEDYELSGSTAEGSEISVCIFERQAKRSEWIPVGGESNGIHVLSFDSIRDRATVTISGARRELAMRRPVITSLGPAGGPGPAPVGMETAAMQANPPTPAAAARDQREARMMVSDLLEIGMQQRRAYQAAKAKGSQAPAAATPPAAPPPPDN
jgi:hypothetical protein